MNQKISVCPHLGETEEDGCTWGCTNPIGTKVCSLTNPGTWQKDCPIIVSLRKEATIGTTPLADKAVSFIKSHTKPKSEDKEKEVAKPSISKKDKTSGNDLVDWLRSNVGLAVMGDEVTFVYLRPRDYAELLVRLGLDPKELM